MFLFRYSYFPKSSRSFNLTSTYWQTNTSNVSSSLEKSSANNKNIKTDDSQLWMLCFYLEMPRQLIAFRFRTYLYRPICRWINSRTASVILSPLTICRRSIQKSNHVNLVASRYLICNNLQNWINILAAFQAFHRLGINKLKLNITMKNNEIGYSFSVEHIISNSVGFKFGFNTTYILRRISYNRQ